MCTCEATASSSCSARVTPHSRAISAACSPIERPGARLGVLRDLAARSAPAAAASACARGPGSDFARLRSSRMWRRSSLTAIGASEAVSTPPAIPASICPSAILLATAITVSSPVPQACWRS